MLTKLKLRASTIRKVVEDADQHVSLYGVPWSQYEALAATRGESSVPQMTYLDGTLDLMTPSLGHEFTSWNMNLLLFAYAEEIGVILRGYGSWTLKNKKKKAGAEADECYCLGPRKPGEKVPELAIEVQWTRGGTDKLKVYRKLGVKEVWFWKRGAITVFELRGEKYERIEKSVAFPDLSLELIARLATEEDTLKAVRELRAWVRKHRKSS